MKNELITLTSPATFDTVDRRPLRHPVTVPAGTWRMTQVDHDDGTSDLELEMVTMKGVPRMAEPLTAYHLANIIAGYLDDRDDIASALVNPSEDVDQAVIEVTSQGGSRFVVPIVALREVGA